MNGTIEMRAIDTNVGRCQRTYAKMDISADTTGDDLSEFVIHLIENVTRPSIKLEFRGDDDFSSILTVPVTIPIEKDSDNGDAPIFTVMSQTEFDELYERILEEMVEASMSIAWDCRSEGADDVADQFIEIKCALEMIE